MRIAIVSQLAGKTKVYTTMVTPQIGWKVEDFYTPMPAIEHVVFMPSEKTCSELGIEQVDVLALIK